MKKDSGISTHVPRAEVRIQKPQLIVIVHRKAMIPVPQIFLICGHVVQLFPPFRGEKCCIVQSLEGCCYLRLLSTKNFVNDEAA
jgi:hypothetical protein